MCSGCKAHKLASTGSCKELGAGKAEQEAAIHAEVRATVPCVQPPPGATQAGVLGQSRSGLRKAGSSQGSSDREGRLPSGGPAEEE